MATGHFIREGDKTTCGGVVIEADTRVMMFGVAHAREGDWVTCGKDGKAYTIVGGVSYINSHGRLVAGTLDSVSSCPCRARLIPSHYGATYHKETNTTPTRPAESQMKAPLSPRTPMSSAAAQQSRSTAPQPSNRPTSSCVFAKSCMSVPPGSTDAGTAPERAIGFGTTALLASTGAAGNLGRVAGTLGSELGSWAVRGLTEAAVGASSALSVVLLALWPRDIGDSTLYTPEELASMRSANTRVRFQFRRDQAGNMQIYGLHTRPGSGAERVPVTQARWNANKSAMVAVLDGISITWTPNSGPIVNAPTPYPGAPETLINLLVHPIPLGQETRFTHYPGGDAHDLTWQDTIITFPADSGVQPLYLVFAKPLSGDHRYHTAPKVLSAFPDTVRDDAKSSVQGGGKKRRRWKDKKGRIYEWDSQHGAVEIYDKQGKHLGEFDADTGEMKKPPKAGRTTPK